MQKPLRKKSLFRNVSIVNLNHAVMTLPFEANVDIHDTVRDRDVIKK
jgi:hypothetical protein